MRVAREIAPPTFSGVKHNQRDVELVTEVLTAERLAKAALREARARADAVLLAADARLGRMKLARVKLSVEGKRATARVVESARDSLTKRFWRARRKADACPGNLEPDQQSGGLALGTRVAKEIHNMSDNSDPSEFENEKIVRRRTVVDEWVAPPGSPLQGLPPDEGDDGDDDDDD